MADVAGVDCGNHAGLLDLLDLRLRFADGGTFAVVAFMMFTLQCVRRGLRLTHWG